jgi:hypothetical protein
MAVRHADWDSRKGGTISQWVVTIFPHRWDILLIHVAREYFERCDSMNRILREICRGQYELTEEPLVGCAIAASHQPDEGCEIRGRILPRLDQPTILMVERMKASILFG